ncbi:Taurine catabolism dioxygenase TauD/TfdA [Penicillium verhagenii]|uniref:Taurine catabolism dioxygenase TauD/TfdA n=1 Tax=Penicillium verhagenii TaxID=1562060 RepID=UPI0025457B0F|nr:Taurine catabolism dioxygenase TauD/TfdA [Penicillium verhagenii]KAJ5935623.1 Taurine catabolism dioxygenase TauD/TfdA [Penicillium verhagenii]
MTTTTICCKPLSPLNVSNIDFGVELTGIDVEAMNDDDFKILRQALYENQVVVIKNQGNLTPRGQYELTRRFDPAAGVYSHGKSIDKRSVLHADLTTIPHQPQVQVIGHGFVKEYEGLSNIQLRHPHHKAFHKTPISAEENEDFTHFYRWHIDSAMYNLDPPLVTSLLAVQVPKGRRQTCRYDDGTDATLDVPLGTTAFFSGYRLYELLSEEEKHFVRTSKAEYAPHPYIWMSKAKSRSNGLGIVSEGLELAEEDLPPFEAEKVKTYPMAWKNPVTGKLAMMVYPTCVRKIHLENGEVLDNLPEIRERLYRLQRRGIDPSYIYPHNWEEGDLVLFNNHGVMHSIVGSFKDDEVRVFRQCNMAASRPPMGPLTV